MSGSYVRWLAAAVVALVLLGSFLVWRYSQSTAPTDPLAHTFAPAYALNVKRGDTLTVVFPLSTASTERATILSARGTTTRQGRVTAVHGLSEAFGFAGGMTVAAVAHSARARVVPVAGLRFTTATSVKRGWLATHVFLAVTVTATGNGCLDIPPLRMRYQVGDTAFNRLVPVPVRLYTGKTDGNTCLLRR